MNARHVAAALALAVGTGAAYRADAVDFSVYPVKVELSQRQQTAMLSLHNDSAQPLRLQVRAFVWDMDATGQWQLTPTDDLIVNPQLFEIGANQAAQLRVGTLLSPGATERAFRLQLDELPGSDEDAGNGNVRIRMLARISMPVFLEPADAKAAASLDIAHVAAAAGRLAIALRNVGNVRFDPQPVQVSVRDAGGRELLHAKPMLGYLLPGAQSQLKIDIPAQACAAAVTVSVSAAMSAAANGARVDDKSCASASSSAR